MTGEPMTDADVERLRATVFAYNRGELRTLALYGSSAARLLARLDAERSRADTAEAERDAAVARAMPEAIYVDSEAVVESIDGFGNYMVARGSSWFLYERFEGWWFKAGDVGELPNSHMVGTWIVRLPDLPTPTAAQEG